MKYKEFLNEKVSDVNKEYTDKIYNILNDGYGRYNINLLNPRLPI